AQIVLVNSSENDQLKVNSCAVMTSPNGVGFPALCGDTDAHGIANDQVLELWPTHGAPVIYLGTSENCEDLEVLFANPNTPTCHLKAVRAWLNEVRKRGDKASKFPNRLTSRLIYCLI